MSGGVTSRPLTSPAKRSSSETGGAVMSIGVAIAALAAAAKGPPAKVDRHQARQRASVRRSSPGTTDRRAKRDGVAPSISAESNVTTVARWT